MEVWNYFHVDSLGQLYINVIFALWILAVLAQTVKPLSTVRETQVRALGWEDPLEKEMAIHSSTIAFPGGSGSKASAHNAGDPGSIPGERRSLGEGNGNPLQYSCLENPMYC